MILIPRYVIHWRRRRRRRR